MYVPSRAKLRKAMLDELHQSAIFNASWLLKDNNSGKEIILLAQDEGCGRLHCQMSKVPTS